PHPDLLPFPTRRSSDLDNGRIWFDHVRVPRDALLNRYGEVGPDGRYSSSIDSSNRRFFTMLGNLVQGRVCIAGASVTAAKKALRSEEHTSELQSRENLV